MSSSIELLEVSAFAATLRLLADKRLVAQLTRSLPRDDAVRAGAQAANVGSVHRRDGTRGLRRCVPRWRAMAAHQQCDNGEAPACLHWASSADRYAKREINLGCPPPWCQGTRPHTAMESSAVGS